MRLDALVGRGGAGAVWSGTETASGARVAVKLLDRPVAGREAALMAGVRHPHVLPLRRVVTDPPALVTVLAPGGSLAAQVGARGTLTAGEVVTVLAPLADALGALHAQGVVHGDVTATNILFVDRGRPVLADLGVAGLAGDGVPWATPGYAAPEVLAGARPGAAADVHGLGAAAWLALTGSTPPPEPDRLPLGLLAPECPAALLAAVTAALDPDPARRPGPGDLATAARAACPGLPVGLVPAAARGVRADEAVTYRVREAAATDPARPAGRWPRRVLHRLDAAGGRLLSRLRPTWPGPRPGSAVAVRLACALVVGAGFVGAGVVGAGLVDGAPVAVGAGAEEVPGPGRAQPRDPAEPTDTAQPSDPAQPADTAPARPVTVDEGGEGPDDLAATVAALVEARQLALRAGDAQAVARVHDPDGTTFADDRELVRSGPVDVSYEVVAVRPLAGSAASAEVELLTTAGGVTTTEQVVLELAAVDGGWRVRTVGR